MNFYAGDMLINEIVPRLTNLVPNSVMPVGSEDPQELLQDAIAMAAQLLDRCLEAGKSVTAGNIAYYTIQTLKSGRRSTSAKAMDVMGPATQFRGRSATVSIDQPIGSESDDIPMTLADMLADYGEDPATEALRSIDWEGLEESSTSREMAVARALAGGYELKEIARQYEVSPSSFNTARNTLARRITDQWGPDVLKDAAWEPQWKANIDIFREHRTCRYEVNRDNGGHPLPTIERCPPRAFLLAISSHRLW